ncbi:TetR/AcrR family transcriptional regulator [Catellatospora sp. NPDC049609]|uniref:TetR/AcrR family transcriptional regulator n=1 Tax=Catellatospora sp. NPDC049609 TaxID=3155505 RepID=UPI0034157DA4
MAGTARPGGRTARNRAAVLDAVRAELAEAGYAGTTVDRIAQRAGVAKTTVYRRWGSIEGLVVDLLGELSAAAIPLPDTGDVESDLRDLARGIVALLQDPVDSAPVTAVIAAAIHTPAARQALTDFYAARIRHAAHLVDRAVERGQLPAGTDAVEVIRLVGAPIYYRALVTGEPIDDAVAHRAAAAAVAAARAGAATTTPDH